MLRAGAAGFLVWSIRPEDLIGLVQVAAEGHTVLSPAAAAADRGLRRSAPARDRARHLAASLTGREAQVPACLGEGLSNAQIAARLYLSEARVKGYVSQVLDKLGCATAPAACSPTTPRYRQLVARVAKLPAVARAGCAAGRAASFARTFVPAGCGGPHGPAASRRLLRSCR